MLAKRGLSRSEFLAKIQERFKDVTMFDLNQLFNVGQGLKFIPLIRYLDGEKLLDFPEEVKVVAKKAKRKSATNKKAARRARPQSHGKRHR